MEVMKAGLLIEVPAPTTLPKPCGHLHQRIEAIPGPGFHVRCSLCNVVISPFQWPALALDTRPEVGVPEAARKEMDV